MDSFSMEKFYFDTYLLFYLIAHKRKKCEFYHPLILKTWVLRNPIPKAVCTPRGSFKNHVDNRGWVGGLKFVIFVHV